MVIRFGTWIILDTLCAILMGMGLGNINKWYTIIYFKGIRTDSVEHRIPRVCFI